MRARGINYDTGFIAQPHKPNAFSTHEPFDPDVVRRELKIIRDDLHCTAVRITGGDPDRLEITARHAAELGLEVWFSPFTCDLTTDELLDFLADCAERAERIRHAGTEVVFLTGAELSLFTAGFLPGPTIEERLEILKKPGELRPAMAGVPALLNEFLSRAVQVVRERFGGPVSYAAIPSFEGVDWTPFDFVSVDAYRTKAVADVYPASIRALVADGKPVAITEFGCSTFTGAADLGSGAADIVEYDGHVPVGIKGDFVPDEADQVRYLTELLDVFEAEGVDTAFVYTFANYHLPDRDGLDLASMGLVRVFEDRRGTVYPELNWEPKAAFATVAERYRA